MNLKKKIFTAVIISVIGLMSWGTGFAQERTAVLLGYIIIPDIVQTMDRIEKIAATVDPEKYKESDFKDRAEEALADSELENIDRSRPIMLMLFRNTTKGSGGGMTGLYGIEYAAIVPVKDRDRYMKALQKKNIPCEINDDRIVISNQKSSLFFAQKEMRFYRKISKQNYNVDARLMVKIDNIMSVYSAGIETTLKMFQRFNRGMYSGQNRDYESEMAIGRIFLYSLLELAYQSKEFQVDLSIDEKRIDFFSEYRAMPGSPLSRFFDGETRGDNRCFSVLPGKGQITYAGFFDMKRFREFVDSLLQSALKRDPSLEKYINRDLINAYMDYTKLYNGEFALTYGFSKKGRLEMNFSAATGSSEDEINAVNERFMSLYKDVMEKMGEGMSGFSGYTIQKNFRKSNGIDVNRYVMEMDVSKMAVQEQKLMQKIFGKEYSIEYAVSNGFMVGSTDPEKLDKMIVNTTAEADPGKLFSMEAFGPGMDSYADFDIISFMERIIEISRMEGADEADPSFEQIRNLIKSLDDSQKNIMFSSKYSKGTSYTKYRIPTKMITEIIKSSKSQSGGGDDEDIYKDEEPYEDELFDEDGDEEGLFDEDE